MRVFLFLSSVAVCAAVFVFGLIPELKSTFPGLYKIYFFPDGYDKIAMNLLQGYGYRFYPESTQTMVRTPLYPLVLASLFYFTGKNLAAAQVLNLFFGLFTACFIFLLSKHCLLRAGQKPPTSRLLLPAVIFLLHPAVILAETRGGVESLLMLLITAFIYCLYKAFSAGTPGSYVVAGLVFGLVLLTKSSPALFAFFLIAYAFLLSKRQSISVSRYCINLGAFFLVCSLVYSPWIVRNYGLTGKIVPTATIKGFVAHQGLFLNKNYFSGRQAHALFREDADRQNALLDEFGLETYKRKYLKHFYTPNDELKFDNYLFKDVVHQYQSSPLFFVKSAALNFVGFWFKGRTTNSTILNMIVTLPLLVLFIFGLREAYMSKIDVVPMVLFIGAFLIPHLLTLGLSRYHVPIIPLLIIVAVLPLQRGNRTLDRSIDRLMGTKNIASPAHQFRKLSD